MRTIGFTLHSATRAGRTEVRTNVAIAVWINIHEEYMDRLSLVA